MEKTSRPGLSIVHSRCLHVCCQVLVVEGPNQHRCTARHFRFRQVTSVPYVSRAITLYDVLSDSGRFSFARVHFHVSFVAVGFLKRTTSPWWSVPSFLLVRL